MLSYSQGYDVSRDEPDETLIKEAVDRAREADVAVIFCGLTDNFESEAFDRETMSMPESHNRLIRDVAHANPNTVVVLENGSPVEMPWLDDVKGVLESYLGGEAGEAQRWNCCMGIRILPESWLKPSRSGWRIILLI